MANHFQLEAADGRRLTGYEWRPEGDPSRHALVVHGQGEHLGRYEYLGEVLAEQGVRTLGVDFRGHGMSAGRRGHVRRWSDYMLDLDAAAAMLPDRFSILGHSMGGLVALGFAARFPERTLNLVLSGPLLGVAVQAPAWKTALSGVLSRVLPGLPIASGIPLEQLSTDPETVALFRDDSLRVKVITPRWYTEMQEAVQKVWADLEDYRVPLHLHLADQESIVDRLAAEKLYELWPAEKRRWLWNGMHEILQEPFRAGVVAAMLEGI